MEPTYRKSLLNDRSDLERIVLADRSNIQNVFLSRSNSTNINLIISNAVSDCFLDQLFTVEYSSKIIGFVQFYGFSHVDSSIFMGYLLDKDFRGQKLLAKICNNLINKYFEAKGVNVISTLVRKDNLASIKFIEKLKFRFESEIIVKSQYIWKRKNKLTLYSLTKSNFINL